MPDSAWKLCLRRACSEHDFLPPILACTGLPPCLAADTRASWWHSNGTVRGVIAEPCVASGRVEGSGEFDRGALGEGVLEGPAWLAWE
eukprot:51534-Alexandrium_andersonii.AAC.1